MRRRTFVTCIAVALSGCSASGDEGDDEKDVEKQEPDVAENLGVHNDHEGPPIVDSTLGRGNALNVKVYVKPEEEPKNKDLWVYFYEGDEMVQETGPISFELTDEGDILETLQPTDVPTYDGYKVALRSQ
ncbi:hypothetical protein [Natrinema sp. DC36]|uniref:hypothetical protein n=1 Tax=Natrinema sp. DC36 TaxID=2878680 RepID=UPI001CF04B71|nr:hypothetical protein [Natrinema sp. DC36]